MTIVAHGGYEIHAYRQVHWPPFGDFTANVWSADKSRMFNVEADSLEAVILKSKTAIDRRKNEHRRIQD